jgi:transposase
MSPKARLEPYLSLEDLKNQYKQAKDRVEARRWHLLMLVAQSRTIKQAAELVGLNYDYAKSIIRRYNLEGPASVRNRMKERQPPTPRSLLTPEQQQELQQALKSAPPEGGNWSGPKVARWIANKTGRDRVWAQRGWEYMQRFGATAQIKRSS